MPNRKRAHLQAVRVQDLGLDVEEGVGDAGETGAEGVDVALSGGERVVHPGWQFNRRNFSKRLETPF